MVRNALGLAVLSLAFLALSTAGCGRIGYALHDLGEGGAAGAVGAPDPTCADAVRNGDETDVDCGGGACAACADGAPCSGPTDCQSSVCAAGVCQPSVCADGVQNGTETDVDCGGGCVPCENGSSCLSDTDCVSGLCANRTCTEPDQDLCPDDPDKTEPGTCGCGIESGRAHVRTPATQ